MLQGTYTAALGINSHQKRIDTIANNLANVNTYGYKAVRADFRDALYSTMTRAAGNLEDHNMELGHGVLVDDTRRIYTQGAHHETNIFTNMMIQGEGYFTVRAANGQTYYTRDGSFGRSVTGDTTYLVDANGGYVLDTAGNPIELRGEDVVVDKWGGLHQNGEEPVYQTLNIVRFPNDEGLASLSNNLLMMTPASGQPERANMGVDTTVIQNYVEASNVNLADEFSALVRATRAMQLSSRALTMADEMDGTANTIRR